MALSLKQKQRDAIVKMLNLNHPVVSGGTADEEVYKVLVLDRFCRDILSPLIHLNELRKHGITLCLMIDMDRQNIPDAPAIYFVQPTSNNIQKIVLDASRGIYQSLHLNFVSSLPRPLLEELAAGTLKSNSMNRISKVFDQYLDFVTLENGMFSLAQRDAYVQLNDPHAKDHEVESVVESVASGLFSVLVTLGTIPIIRCAKGGVAEATAALLDSKIRDHLGSRNNLFVEAGHLGPSFQRPVLCLFDRDFELSVAVQHVWNYRPLVHDVLGMKLNRVQIHGEPNTPGKGKAAAKSFELDDSDSFWVANSSAVFPKVAEEVETQLKKYKEDVEDVNKRAGGGQAGHFDDQELFGNTKHLMNAVNSLPELTERKKMIDKHTNIATALLSEIKTRNIDGFCSTEEDMLTRGTVDRSALLGLIKGKGSKDDKLRLAIVCLLAMESSSAADIDAVQTALQEMEVDISSFLCVKKTIRSLNFSMSSVNAASRSNIVDWAEKLYGQSLSAVTAGVKNLLSGGRQLAVTRVVEALMEAKPIPEIESYLTFDPRAPKGSGSSGSHNKGPFKEAIVFMIGGGNYLEYGILQELAQRQPTKSVIYGSTEILTGQEFVNQLAMLGQKMTAPS